MIQKIKAIWRILKAKQYAVMTDDPDTGIDRLVEQWQATQLQLRGVKPENKDKE